jgi:Zn-finger nucleic acid-binding protein
MICPNDDFEMHQVSIVSHYGQTVILDQCQKCGGIWFDESELFRARQGEAAKIDPLDQDALNAPALISNPRLICPRDRNQLFRFTDRHFPESIILTRCPSCHGIWLNRGEFIKFQQARQDSLQASSKRESDTKLSEQIAQLTASNQSGQQSVILGKLGNFLSTEMDKPGSLNVDSSSKSIPAQDTANVAVGIVLTLLRVFLHI